MEFFSGDFLMVHLISGVNIVFLLILIAVFLRSLFDYIDVLEDELLLTPFLDDVSGESSDTWWMGDYEGREYWLHIDSSAVAFFKGRRQSSYPCMYVYLRTESEDYAGISKRLVRRLGVSSRLLDFSPMVVNSGFLWNKKSYVGKVDLQSLTGFMPMRFRGSGSEAVGLIVANAGGVPVSARQIKRTLSFMIEAEKVQ